MLSLYGYEFVKVFYNIYCKLLKKLSKLRYKFDISFGICQQLHFIMFH